MSWNPIRSRRFRVRATIAALAVSAFSCDDPACPSGTVLVRDRCLFTDGGMSTTVMAETMADADQPSAVSTEAPVAGGGASGTTGFAERGSPDSGSPSMTAGANATMPMGMSSANASNAPAGAPASVPVGPSCGNGAIDANETCDPISQCPTPDGCRSSDTCLVARFSGAPASCDAKCDLIPTTACAAGDGCCPAGCTFATDQDCSKSCGDGVISPPETCEPNTATPCPTSCDDANPCTLDTMTGSTQQCNVTCTHTPMGSGAVNSCGGCTVLQHAKGAACSAGSGACIGSGSYECQGPDATVCNAKPNTAADTCDGRDNDCDGRVDENVANGCGGCARLQNNPGQTCTAGTGRCMGTGTYQCQGKDSVTCSAKANTQPETCDNVDNDCDGIVDEDTGRAGSCELTMGACRSTGSWICKQGAQMCDARPPGETEICANDKDDDCDGAIDERETSGGQPYPPGWFLDCDGDGGGNPEIATNSCGRPPDVKGCRFVTRTGSDPPQADCACLK